MKLFCSLTDTFSDLRPLREGECVSLKASSFTESVSQWRRRHDVETKVSEPPQKLLAAPLQPDPPLL